MEAPSIRRPAVAPLSIANVIADMAFSFLGFEAMGSTTPPLQLDYRPYVMFNQTK
jgi:hypothetical protein